MLKENFIQNYILFLELDLKKYFRTIMNGKIEFHGSSLKNKTQFIQIELSKIKKAYNHRSDYKERTSTSYRQLF